ncbi:MAG: cobalamin-binding protein [Acidobacteriaceae bacterium]
MLRSKANLRVTLIPVRIASLQPSVSLTLAALGRLDTLCACTRFCLEALPELAARNLPVLHDSWSFGAHPHELKSDSASLLAARPDLLVASVPYRLETLAAILRSGYPVLALAPHTLANIFADINLLGSIVHAGESAATLVASMQATLEGTRIYTATATSQPLIYCEEWGKPLIHSQPWVAELVTAANGRFLGTPGAHTTPDEVAAADPDVLLFAWCGAGNRVPLQKVIAQRNWENLRAVRDRRVHVIPDEFLNTPAPSLLKGLACLASSLHPQLYPPHPELITLR